MTDPNNVLPVGDETAVRRQRLAAMLRGMAPPAEGYRTREGTAMNLGAQTLSALGQNGQFMKWLSGQFDPMPKPPGMAMEPMTGRAVGPV